MIYWRQAFYILQNLQDSQTYIRKVLDAYPFYILQNLQDSQTPILFAPFSPRFTSFKTYKTLKHIFGMQTYLVCFTSFKTYKTLKLAGLSIENMNSFTSFKTYKTLKPQIQFQILSELNTVTGAVSLFQIDYTIILIDNTCFFAVQFRFLHIF